MGDRLQIRLIGGFAVGDGDWLVPEDAWRLRKARTLVKLLALDPGRRAHRESVAELLWPGSTRQAALNNLNQTVHAARRALDAAGIDGAEAIAVRGDALCLCPDMEPWIDVRVLEAAADEARAARTIAAYRAALELAHAELLPEDAYEDWAAAPRDHLRALRTSLLTELSDLHLMGQDRTAAIEALRAAAAHDELNEDLHRRLMSVLAETGRRQEALELYQRLREALDRAFAADPDPETRRLYRELLAAGADSEEERAAGNLPLALTSFIAATPSLRRSASCSTARAC